MTWGLVAVAFGLVALATLVPGSPSASGGGTPFWCLTCGDFALADAVANVVLFVPLGWALGRARVPPIVGLAALVATTITVEWLQYTVVPGRDASLSDILTNPVGAAIGMAVPCVHRNITTSSGRVLWAATLYGVLLVAGLGVGEGAQALLLPRRLRWTDSRRRGGRRPCLAADRIGMRLATSTSMVRRHERLLGRGRSVALVDQHRAAAVTERSYGSVGRVRRRGNTWLTPCSHPSNSTSESAEESISRGSSSTRRLGLARPGSQVVAE